MNNKTFKKKSCLGFCYLMFATFLSPSAIQSNFVSYFAPDFMRPGYDQFVYRHANGLCVVGLAPTHVAFKEKGGITSVDFNVGKSNRSKIRVSGKRKKNAQFLESNSALCKVCTNDASYIVRCCVKGSLLEVNDRLIKQPELLNSSTGQERKEMQLRENDLTEREIILGMEEFDMLESNGSFSYAIIVLSSSIDGDGGGYGFLCKPALMYSFLLSCSVSLLESDREGYIAIIMPKPADWDKIKASLLGFEEYKKLRDMC
ncbi:hypothetical protein FNV43_RR10484 [Rhamnella rubrinervis]|uniref:Actin-binding transcription modulator n=1 Tax=Rhamnella rubrinervis TaxID=2594499 RepID=A0A8K0MGC4_9ROSA|nr:hypothetical protein FNV43_RR10484 [Rhamnella rubrinervis]